MYQLSFGVLQVKIRYTFSRNGITYYQRSVPLELIPRCGSKTVKTRIKATTPAGIAKEVESLNRKYEALWSRLRDDPTSSGEALTAHAEELLKSFGLSPNSKNSQPDPIALEVFNDHFDNRRYEYIDGLFGREATPEQVNTVSGDDYLTPIEIEASKLLNTTKQPGITDAMEFYFERHPKGADEGFQKVPRIAAAQLIESLGGDKAVTDVSRADVRKWIDSSIEKGHSRNTIVRRVTALKAIFSMYIRDHELEVPNRFDKHTIPAAAKKAQERNTFSSESLKAIQKACIEADDDRRWAIAILSDTCTRLAEVIGLRLSDIVLDAPIPHLRIVDHEARTLKTADSTRDIPLVGVALWAATRIKETAPKGGTYAFPRYITKANKCNATAASATLNKWINGLGFIHTTHEFRHTMSDRLRDVGCPEDIRKQIGGWSRTKDMSESYGKGYTLERTQEWLNRVVIR